MMRSASHFKATRISMAEAVFKKTAEERPDRHGVVIPGCCHTCGGNLRTHHRGHDDSKGKAYEGRTREACYELEVIRAVGPCSICTDVEGYLRGEHEGKASMLARLAKVCLLATWTRTVPSEAGPGSVPTGTLRG